MSTTDTQTSTWSTNKRYGWASREVGLLTLIAHRGVFLLLSDKIVPIEAATLEEAIDQADTLSPPTGWSRVVGLWLSRGWKVQREEGGWAVYDEYGTRMSRQFFPRADLARKWCEVRQDRVGINLRGPKPKEKGGRGLVLTRARRRSLLTSEERPRSIENESSCRPQDGVPRE